MDPISDVFTALEVQSVIYGRFEFGAPWGIRFPPGHASFGMVLRGRCWLETEGSDALSLDGGDCYVLPRGVAYSLRDEATSALVDIDQITGTLDATHRFGGDGRTTVMLTGCFTLDSSFSKPVVDLLPSTIHIKADEPQSSTLHRCFFSAGHPPLYVEAQRLRVALAPRRGRSADRQGDDADAWR